MIGKVIFVLFLVFLFAVIAVADPSTYARVAYYHFQPEDKLWRLVPKNGDDKYSPTREQVDAFWEANPFLTRYEKLPYEPHSSPTGRVEDLYLFIDDVPYIVTRPEDAIAGLDDYGFSAVEVDKTRLKVELRMLRDHIWNENGIAELSAVDGEYRNDPRAYLKAITRCCHELAWQDRYPGGYF